MRRDSTGAELLIVFVKYPEPGRVKTRLAAGVGDDQAVSIYRELVDLTLVAAAEWQRAASPSDTAARPRHIWICFDPPEAAALMHPWLQSTVEGMAPPVRWVVQSGATLGERMMAALHQALSDGFSAICIIGTDCPALTAEVVLAAFRQLAAHDLVLGPASDGGYYLIGLKKEYNELFINIPWSSASTLTATLASAEKLRLQVARLPTLDDIDTEQDWRRWQGARRI